MLLYAMRRICLGIVILLVTTLGLFSLIHVIPGDPAVIALGPHATPEMRADFRAEMGLDLSLPVQFLRFLGHVLSGDLGIDVWSRRPVGAMIMIVCRASLSDDLRSRYLCCSKLARILLK